MNRIVLLLLFILSMNNIRSQSLSPEVLSSSGETFVCQTFTIDWTLGELAITTIQNTNNQITQGFHQSYELTDINELPIDIGSIKVFPNPISNWLHVELNFLKHRSVQIKLLDNNGKLVLKKSVSGQQIVDKLSIHDLPIGTYLINFQIDKSVYSQTIKIQKTK